MKKNINQLIHPEQVDSKAKNKILPSIEYIMKESKLYFIQGTIETIDERMIR